MWTYYTLLFLYRANTPARNRWPEVQLDTCWNLTTCLGVENPVPGWVVVSRLARNWICSSLEPAPSLIFPVCSRRKTARIAEKWYFSIFQVNNRSIFPIVVCGAGVDARVQSQKMSNFSLYFPCPTQLVRPVRLGRIGSPPNGNENFPGCEQNSGPAEFELRGGHNRALPLLRFWKICT